MTSDSKLVERLREFAPDPFSFSAVHAHELAHEAAEALSSLRGKVEELTGHVAFQKNAITGIGKLAYDENGDEWKSRALAAEAKAVELEIDVKSYKMDAEQVRLERYEAESKVERLEMAPLPGSPGSEPSSALTEAMEVIRLARNYLNGQAGCGVETLGELAARLNTFLASHSKGE